MKKESDSDNSDPRRPLIRILRLIAFILIPLLLLFTCSLTQVVGQQQAVEISTSQLYQAIDAKTVKTIIAYPESSNVEGEFNDGKRFTSRVSDIGELEKKAVASGIEYITANPPNPFMSVLLGIIPWILIILIFWFFISAAARRAQGGGGGGLFNSFVSSRFKMEVIKPIERLSDVAGCEEAKEEVAVILEFLKNPRKFSRLGARIPRGLILFGPTGTGKTLMAKALAGEADASIITCSGSDFVEMYVGVGASRVRHLFDMAKKNAPCILFIDEFDAIGRRRGHTTMHNDEREQTLNQLLVEMDGFNNRDGVIVMAGTNRPDILDSALLRPGRFDRKIEVPLPDVKGRESILKVHAQKIKIAADVDFLEIAKMTVYMSGADLANIVNEAAIIAALNEQDAVTQENLIAAAKKVQWGLEKKNKIIPQKEREMIAYHEAGHTLVAKLTEGADPVQGVTIIPRGRSGGATHFLPEYDRSLYTKKYLTGRIAISMGGSVAEKLVFDEESTGPCSDYQHATEITKKMVCEYGMSEKVGKLVIVRGGEMFMPIEQLDCSQATHRIIEEEMKRLTDEGYQAAMRILTENRAKLDALAKALLEKETLNANEINEIISSA